MVGHPVEYHLHAHAVDAVDQGFELLHGTELRIDGFIIGNGVVTSQGSFPVLLANRIDRHKPKDLDAHFLKAREMLRESRKSSLRRVLADVHLVDIGVFHPIERAFLLISHGSIFIGGFRIRLTSRDRQKSEAE